MVSLADIGRWQKTPEGEYIGLGGRAHIKRKGKKEWVVVLDGKEHAIKSRKPSFDHAEAILRKELRLASSVSAGSSYTRLYYQLVEILMALRNDHDKDPKRIGEQALVTLRMPKVARETGSFQQLYYRLVDTLREFERKHDAEARIVLQAALETLKRKYAGNVYDYDRSGRLPSYHSEE